MKHEICEKSLDIIENDITFEQIYKKKYIPQEYINDIKKQIFLLFPTKTFVINDKLRQLWAGHSTFEMTMNVYTHLLNNGDNSPILECFCA